MTRRSYDTTTAFRELLDVLREADASFLEGFRAVPDDVSVLEGYRWLTETLSVALDCYLWADPDRPEFVPIVSPTRKFGGDNPDAFYFFAPLDPRRTYRVRGQLRDCCYLSLCVYGGPTDGRWSNRIVGSIHDGEMTLDPDGRFEVTLSPVPQPGNWIALQPDAVCVVTRDYLWEPRTGVQARYTIEAVDPAPPPAPLADGDLARRLRATANFLRDLGNVCPIPLPGEPNTVMEPYRVPEVTYGWAAPDAVYAMGRFELADHQALVVEGHPPECRFWNLCLWNQFLQTYDYRYQRVSLNGRQIRYEPDGSYRLVIAASDPGPGCPNWISTAGHRQGVLWFRWFLAPEVPARPRARVVDLASLRAPA